MISNILGFFFSKVSIYGNLTYYNHTDYYSNVFIMFSKFAGVGNKIYNKIQKKTYVYVMKTILTSFANFLNLV